ncbi:type VI secretion system ImpA family N-terminal domain-containing protein [Vibrio maritimus]|uniref:type VI secretion system ImpA family N-terminal domain-containing protein n=1 Tax=Vibrio maritimus TaxID=990268 RepID=UPI001F29D833|nr:type VI secretion system ImpA family N-terminal domain-containing protein [Vibrio maritimus]
MSVSLFIQNTYYVIALDPQALKTYSAYEAVRAEINRRASPLSGGIDWQQVKTQCEWLAKGPGIDLLMAGYWAVAVMKVQGLSGLANGLELLNAVVSMLPDGDSKIAKGRKDILEWVNARVVEELKVLKPNVENLRDLYRCERYCDQLHQMMQLKQPTLAVNFESIGFALFEHIDRLEAKWYTVDHSHCLKETLLPPSSHSWRKQGLFLVLAVLIAVSVGLAYQWKHQWQYFHFERVLNIESLAKQTAMPPFIKEDMTTLLVKDVDVHLSQDFGVQKKQIESILMAFERLSPLEAQPVRKKVLSQQYVAIQRVDNRVERFQNTRTRVANVVGQYKGMPQYQALHSLETYAISLSPVYGRIGYIERLMKENKREDAQKELDILTGRLNDVSWKWAQLHREMSNQKQRKNLPLEQ